ncbi:unnamed protein product [Ceutorhynchus assimilis]|uniref:DUF4806 domain-containing protein n=1 Tax=Ceutorhynchus assimilis TaxID=467358 RepID=A0A9N9QKM5_9CUCU|nr:unnamed protein product [Ceutorhynchus assimilis]
MAEESGTVQKTWTIVKFIDEDTVAMVPTIWLTNSENGWNCLWPPLPANRISVAVRTHEMNTCWPSFKVTMFRNATYDDYQKARKAVLKAEDTSDLNTDVEMTVRRKKINRISSDSSEENDVLVKIRTPPKFTGKSFRAKDKNVKMVKQKLVLSSQLSCHKQNAKLLEPGTSSEGNNQNLSKNVDLTNSNLNDSLGFERHDNGQANESVNASAPKHVQPSVRPRTIASNNSNDPKCTCCPVHVHYIKEILRQLTFIKSRVDDIPIEPILKNPVSLHEKSLFENPAVNDEALSELNNALKDTNFFEKAVNELSRLGGRNIYDFCVRCLKKVMTDELANQYSWLGRRNKKNFSVMEVSKLIIAAAEAGGKAKNKKEVEDAVSGWLRRANDRIKSKR